MVIPEKYRERYDNLARSHPWMRKMVDEQAPEGDVVAILRKWTNFWGVSHSTHTQCDSNWEKTTMLALADMVERDYVSRQDFAAQHRTLCAVREQRDEWKAKAEQAERAMNRAAGKWARADAELRSDDGARQSMTNLEWLYVENKTFHIVCMAFAEEYIGMMTPREEWLLSPHVDDRGQNADMSEKGVDYVRSDGEMSENNADSIAQSNVTQEGESLSELSGNLSDSPSEKLEADALMLVDNLQMYGFKYAGDAEREIIDLLDRQAAITAKQLIGESDAPKSEETVENDTSKDDIRNFDDSREKLEADVRKYLDLPANCRGWGDYKTVRAWLDHQAAITYAEVNHVAGIAAREAGKVLREQIDELKSRHCPHYHVHEHYCDVHETRIADLTADRDRYRDMCGQMLDAAHEIRRITDACMPEGGKEVM